MRQARTYQIQHLPLTCHHCGQHEFHWRRAQLHSAFLTFLDVEWLNPSADVYICAQCGFVHWFLPPPGAAVTAIDVDETLIHCLACDAQMPAQQTQCLQCGWSYQAPAATRQLLKPRGRRRRP